MPAHDFPRPLLISVVLVWEESKVHKGDEEAGGWGPGLLGLGGEEGTLKASKSGEVDAWTGGSNLGVLGMVVWVWGGGMSFSCLRKMLGGPTAQTHG